RHLRDARAARAVPAQDGLPDVSRRDGATDPRRAALPARHAGGAGRAARQLGAGVLDAIAPVRPWSAGDICDFLRASFADELNRRRAETARAIEGTDAVPDELEDDDRDFPPVDTEVADSPDHRSSQDLVRRSPVSIERLSSQEIARRSSKPIRVEPPAPASAPASTQPPVVVVHKRSVLWPLLGIAMVGITAAALYLVWKQRQPPDTIIVTESRSDLPPAADPPPAADGSGPVPPVTDPAGGSAKAGPARPRPGTPSRSGDPYTAVLTAHRPQLNRCMND